MNKEQNYMVEEDEINLRELFDTIWKNKKFIFIFTSVIVVLTFIYAVKTPNYYKSEVVLAPQGEQKSVGGGLSSLAALAGVSIGGGNGMDPETLLKAKLADKSFLDYVITKYDLVKKLSHPKNLVYPFGLKFSKSLKCDEKKDEGEQKYCVRKALKGIISVSSDKKSGLITMSATYYDRFLAKELVDIFLKEATKKIKENDMKNIKQQIKYYKQELSNTKDISLKTQLSKSLSSLVQKEVFSNANSYYIVTKVTDSQVAYIKDKAKPKRALIMIVSLITGMILAIFIVFFREFLKNSADEKDNS